MTGRATKAALSLRPSSRPGSSSQSSTRSFRSCTPSPRAATTTTERTCYFTLPPSAAPAEAGNTITAAQGAFPPSRTVPKHWHSWQPFPTPDSGSRNEWITLTCVLNSYELKCFCAFTGWRICRISTGNTAQQAHCYSQDKSKWWRAKCAVDA